MDVETLNRHALAARRAGERSIAARNELERAQTAAVLADAEHTAADRAFRDAVRQYAAELVETP